MKKIKIQIDLTCEVSEDWEGPYLAQKIAHDLIEDEIKGRYKKTGIEIIAIDSVFKERSQILLKENPRVECNFCGKLYNPVYSDSANPTFFCSYVCECGTKHPEI
jgi:hypothetical protein